MEAKQEQTTIQRSKKYITKPIKLGGTMRRLISLLLLIVVAWGGAFVLIYGMHNLVKRLENGRIEDFKEEIKTAQLIAGIECPDSMIEQLARKANVEKKLSPDMVKEASILWRHVRLLAENLKKENQGLEVSSIIKDNCRRFIEIVDCGLPLEIWGEYCQHRVELVRKFLYAIDSPPATQKLTFVRQLFYFAAKTLKFLAAGG